MNFTMNNGGGNVSRDNHIAAVIGYLYLTEALGNLAGAIETVEIKWISSTNFQVIVCFIDPSGTAGKYESSTFSINGAYMPDIFIIEKIASLGVCGGPLTGAIRQHIEGCSRKHRKFADDANEMLTTGMTAIV